MAERFENQSLVLAQKEKMWNYNRGWISVARIHGAQALFDYTAGVREAIDPKCELCIGCMDERIGRKHIGIAGSGILWGVDETVEAIKANGISQISSHAHCAAATEYAKRTYQNPVFGERCAVDFAEKVAKKAGIDYIGHLEPEDFGHPASTHVAGIVYYSHIPFDIYKTELPRGFVVTKLQENPNGALKDVELAIKIARHEEHGFGNRFTDDIPPMIVGITIEDDNKIRQMQEELFMAQQILKDMPVAVDMVILPSYNQ